MTNVLIKWEIWTQRHAHREKDCKVEGRDQDDAFTSQGPPKTARKPLEIRGKAQTKFSQPLACGILLQQPYEPTLSNRLVSLCAPPLHLG